MRVAYICADKGVPVFGRKGCSIHVQEMLRAMLGRGFEIDLFAARVDGSPPHGLEGVRVHRLPPHLTGKSSVTRASIERYNNSVCEALRDAGPFDLLYERYSLWSDAGMEHAQTAGCPGVLEVNAPLIEEQAAYRQLDDREAAEDVARRAFRTANSLIAVSPEVADSLAKWPEARGRVHVVSNGVNVDRFAARPPVSSRDAEHLTIGFVGTLKPWHGVDDLMQAFARLLPQHPKLRLLIVGDGPERARLEEQARQLGSEAVLFAGAVDPAEVPELLASMEIAVAPYPQMDRCYFSPLKLYEYAAAGVAIVSSRIGEPGRVIEHGVNGLLCEPSDPVDLAIKLSWLIRHPDERDKLGRNARQRVRQHHTWSHVLQRILQLVEERASLTC